MKKKIKKRTLKRVNRELDKPKTYRTPQGNLPEKTGKKIEKIEKRYEKGKKKYLKKD